MPSLPPQSTMDLEAVFVLVILVMQSVTALHVIPPSLLGAGDTVLQTNRVSGNPSSTHSCFDCRERRYDRRFKLWSSSSVQRMDLRSTEAAVSSLVGGADSRSTKSRQGGKEELADSVPITFHAEAVVCGAGPAGLLTAIMLAQRAKNRTSMTIGDTTGDRAAGKPAIHVFERRRAPETVIRPAVGDTRKAAGAASADSGITATADASYSVGVFGRGKLALERFGLWDTVVRPLAQELVGSQTWRSRKDAGSSNTTTVSLYANSGRESIYSLPRDTLVSALYEHIKQTYPDQVAFHFGRHVEPASFGYSEGKSQMHDGSNVALLKVSTVSNSTVHDNGDDMLYWTADLLIGADGAARTVANRMEQLEAEEWQKRPILSRLFSTITRTNQPFSVKRFPDDNPRVYKTIPLKLPDGWRKDIGYSASDFPNRRFSVVTLPSDTEGGLCGVFLMKEGEPLAQADTDPAELRQTLEEFLPVISDLMSDDVVAAVARNPIRRFPQFRYAGPRLHKGDGTVILGDACHSVKPYNGLGVNSAMEDVLILADCLEEEDSAAPPTSTSALSVKNAIRNFSKRRAKDCKAVVTLSRASDRPGRLGKLRFLVPLLMDAYFHQALPSIFTPPIPGLVHNSKYRFHQVAVRKRWERLAQMAIITAGTWLACQAILVMTRIILGSVHKAAANWMLPTTTPVVAALIAPRPWGCS